MAGLFDYFQQLSATSGNVNAPLLPQQPSGADMVGDAMARFTDPNSRYIQQARQRGMEVAAQRGGVNSSIAAGNAERSALDTAQGLTQMAVGIDANRQNQQLDAQYSNWLQSQNFGRSLYQGTFNNTMDMLAAVQRMGLEDPELYTPDVISGYSNFFQQNFGDIIGRYFQGQG